MSVARWGLGESMKTSQADTLRLPDFLIIGAMKSGTTTLFRWLGQHRQVSVPDCKEPDFFSDDWRWRRGLDWYQSAFQAVPPGHVTGEASASYTDPCRSRMAADRIRETLPDVRLLYVVRHPLERLRSHFRHEVQRGREHRAFQTAISSPHNPYVSYSLYLTCLRPYLEAFPREALRVVRFEDLVDGEDTWAAVLAHLGLSASPRPGSAHNVTGQKPGFTPVMRMLWELGLHRPLSRLPRPIRRLGRPLLARSGPAYRRRLEEAREPVPGHIADRLAEESATLASRLGMARPLWPDLPTPGAR